MKEARCFECQKTGRELKQYLERSLTGPYHCRKHRPTQADKWEMKILYHLTIGLFLLGVGFLGSIILGVWPEEISFLAGITALFNPLATLLLFFSLSYQRQQPW